MKHFALVVVLLVSFHPAAAAAKHSWKVGILVYNGVYNTEFIAPLDVFDHVNAKGGPVVDVLLVAPESKQIVSAEKLRFSADFTFNDHPPLDILIIPSFENYQSDIGQRKEIIGWIRKTSESATFVLSNCWGAFFLAQAGLLDGRHAMTYPPDIDRLSQQFPKIEAVKGKRFVRDGKFVTGGGGVASYDNALYVVQELWGERTAKSIASGLVREWDLSATPHLIAAR
ncbi:MAG: DJ-1/PfpI family protein [Acidobacteriota bacterium]